MNKINDDIKKRLILSYLDDKYSITQIEKASGLPKEEIIEVFNQIENDKQLKAKKLIDELNDSLIKRAKGFEYTEVATEIMQDEQGNIIRKVAKQTKKYVVPDITLLKEMLRKTEQDIETPKTENDGKPIKVDLIKID